MKVDIWQSNALVMRDVNVFFQIRREETKRMSDFRGYGISGVNGRRAVQLVVLEESPVGDTAFLKVVPKVKKKHRSGFVSRVIAKDLHSNEQN